MKNRTCFLISFFLISFYSYSQDENLSFLKLVGPTGMEDLKAELVDLTYEKLVSCLNKSPDTITALTIHNCWGFKWEYEVFKRFTKLNSLEMNSCNIQNVPDWISTLNIESIDLKDNDIQKIDLFKLIGNRTHSLTLSKNKNIQPFCSDTLKNLSYLSLSYCNINNQVIADILNFVPNIEYLDLMNNPISDLKIKRDYKLSKLKYLNLEYTPFKNFNDQILIHFPMLRTLFINAEKVHIGQSKQINNFLDMSLTSDKIILGSGIQSIKRLNVRAKKFKISAKKIYVEKLYISVGNKVNLKKIADSLIYYNQSNFSVKQNLEALKKVEVIHFKCSQISKRESEILFKTLKTFPTIDSENLIDQYMKFFKAPKEIHLEIKKILKNRIVDEHLFFG